MHKKGIIHRDLKPDNILVLDKDSMQVCIADLGLACYFSDTASLLKKCGSPGYVDPDILKNLPCTEKSDIFSLGCLLFKLITGK